MYWRIFALYFLGVWAGCVPASDKGARTALNALADVVSPAWQLAEEACVARQAVVVAREKAGLLTPADSDHELSTVRAECDAITAVFSTIRATHEQARQLVEAGELQKAHALVDDIRAEWRALGGAL